MIQSQYITVVHTVIFIWIVISLTVSEMSSFVPAIFAALLSMKVGYRVVAVSGCLLMMSGLFVASWLNSDNVWITGILVGGVAGR